MLDGVQAVYMYFQFTKYYVVCMFSNNLLQKYTHTVITKQASQTLRWLSLVALQLCSSSLLQGRTIAVLEYYLFLLCSLRCNPVEAA